MLDENKKCPTKKISPLAPACSISHPETFSSRRGPGGFFIKGILNLGFTKLDERILQSSIMAEDSVIFKVWIALLASCGPDGIAAVSSVFLSSVCHLGIEIIDAAIKTLENPDKRSRSLKEEGRRIKRVDGGYFVINYEKYRGFSYSKKEEAIRKRKYREQVKTGQLWDMTGHDGTVPDTSASASSSSSSLKEGDRGGEKTAKFAGGTDDEAIASEFKDLWDDWPAKKDKDQAFINYRRERRTHTVEELEKAVEGYEAFLKNQRLKKGFDQTPLYLSTFLNKNRWKEYLDEQYFPSL
jgi:hypothetical protein